ncbi:transposase [Crenobacter sp. SG2303]|uniref:Transposase n=1 Tax=Crenobacter oryzisoli TaxID=3056844 RepID=A0ABT7XVJ6_9NEIS|nr:transposase [Crenobacter sp. SG2303]MDN0077765.1 transposase [Crenobacter sp. SG2303]
MDSATPAKRHRRPNFPLDFKRHLVEASFEPGVSVARLAREHDLNANVLFNWRTQYRQGKLGPIANPVVIPIRILPEPVSDRDAFATEPAQLEVILPKGRLHIQGRPDPITLRLVIEALGGC